MSKFSSFFRPIFIKSIATILFHINHYAKPNIRRRHFKFKLPSFYYNFAMKTINLMKLTIPPINVTQLIQLHTQQNIDYKSTYDIEKEISDLVMEAERLINKDKIADAKKLLQKALKIATDSQVYTNIASVYDLLSTLAYRSGNIAEAEDMLADFIDKLLQLGYPEDHNSVIRFKLKLARLYQASGNIDMAELGLKDCIRAQELKLLGKNGVFDESTNTLYTNSLFWYGKLLADKEQLPRAKYYFKKCLERTILSKTITSNQKMVVYYYNAEISTALGELDNALEYLYTAIDIGTLELYSPNPDLPLYVIKIGMIFIKKGLYSNAEYWCTNGKVLAEGNPNATREAQLCLDQLAAVLNAKKK